MNPLPQSATDYLYWIWHFASKEKKHSDYVIYYVSPELFEKFSSECQNNARGLGNGGPVFAVHFRVVRVKKDYDLKGPEIRITEGNKYAYERFD